MMYLHGAQMLRMAHGARHGAEWVELALSQGCSTLTIKHHGHSVLIVALALGLALALALVIVLVLELELGSGLELVLVLVLVLVLALVLVMVQMVVCAFVRHARVVQERGVDQRLVNCTNLLVHKRYTAVVGHT
jgi:hypothetical protein